jgi:DNA-binding SARP family transcriptional activator/predicted ATPase
MTKTTAPLMIRLFGTPEASTSGVPLALKSQKARALLFYLAITRQPHTRSHLATLLWSEFPADNARRSLRSTLFQLRRTLQAADLSQAIVAEGDLLRLQLAQNACDVTDFRRLVAEGSEPALIEAIALYRGPLLEGFTLPDAPLFDEWLRVEDEKLRQAYLSALKHLASEASAQENWEQALGYLQHLVRTDPLAEEAQQQLIGLYLKTGASAQALRQYQQFEGELWEKLGLTPAPETRALFQEALRLQQTPPPDKTSSRPGLSRRTQPDLPFVGRDSLLTRLLAISQEVKAGRGGTVLLQGDGGIGKTRLLNEFQARLSTETPPWLVLQGACSPFDDLISYGPFLEAFQDTALGDLTDLLLAPPFNSPPVGGTKGGSDGPAARDQFVYRILQTLRRLSQNAPLVLAIDDLQWANSSTLNLFGLLATRLHHLPLLLVGSVQRSEAIPALQRLVTMERRRGQLQLLSLPPLTEEAVINLLHGLAISSTSIPALAKWLQERSDGNPFILDEMVAQLRADAILTPIGDHWQLDPGRWLRWRAAYTLPETTHDLVSWRLRKLTAEAHALLEVLAVAGQPLPFALLVDFPGVPPVEQLLPVIDDLLSRRLLVETSDEMFALSHYLLREVVLHRLSHVRRRMIHRQLAQMLAKCPALEANFPLWEVARHAVAGEDVELARRYSLQILSKLPQDYTGAVTVDFLHHLYDLLTPSASLKEMLRLMRVIGDVHQSLGHLSEATYWQGQYLDLARKTGDTAAQASAHLEKGELALVSNDYLAATEAAEAGLATCALLAETDPAFSSLSGRGHRLLGHALAMEGSDLPAAERHLQKATAAHRLADDPRDLCASLFELGNVAAQRGELLRALEFYEEAAHVAEAGQAHYIHALARNNFAYHSLLLGWLKAAQRALAHGQRLAETYELLGALLHLSSTQGEIHLYLAEWEAARQTFQRGLALAEELGNPERQAGYRASLALAARGQHDLSGATTLLEEALLLISDRGYWHLRTRLLIWLAETLLLAERFAEAWPYLNAALETGRLHGWALLHLQAERLRACLLAAGSDWPAAEACFTQTVAQATKLDLPLEIARTQAAWGQATLRFSPSPHQGHALLSQARRVFADHQATAELNALELQYEHLQ